VLDSCSQGNPLIFDAADDVCDELDLERNAGDRREHRKEAISVGADKNYNVQNVWGTAHRESAVFAKLTGEQEGIICTVGGADPDAKARIDGRARLDQAASAGDHLGAYEAPQLLHP
jgi:hypothetical protein